MEDRQPVIMVRLRMMEKRLKLLIELYCGPISTPVLKYYQIVVEFLMYIIHMLFYKHPIQKHLIGKESAEV